MTKLRCTVKKKAAKATVRHSARGVLSKLQRKPLRTTRLLSFGVLLGAAVGWVAAKRTA